MSIKIYNAYLCDKNYTMYEMMQKIAELRDVIRQEARKKRTEYVVKEYVHYMDYLDIFGVEPAKAHYAQLQLTTENAKKLSEHSMRNIWSLLAKNVRAQDVWLSTLDNYFIDKTYEDSNSRLRMDSDFDYNCSITVIPMENQQLLMAFGNQDFIDIIRKQPWLSDYHYQNQTDAPHGISDEEWEERKRTWNKAIGPDYIPANHGMEIKLFDSAQDFIHTPILEGLSQFEPDLQERAKWLMDYMKDYPNPPTGSYSVEWIRYLRSAEYLDWYKKRFDEVIQKLPDISVLWQA